MKRSRMPGRKSPLSRGQSLVRASPLQRRVWMPTQRTSLLNRPKPRTPAETNARTVVALRSGGMCELGITCSGGAYATDVCHRVARSQGGPWDPANLLAGCRACHGHTHSWPAEARAHGWMVRRGHDYLTIPVAHAVHGWVLLRPDGSYQPTTERPSA